MSAIGTKRTSLVALHMSAIGGKADIAQACGNCRSRTRQRPGANAAAGDLIQRKVAPVRGEVSFY